MKQLKWMLLATVVLAVAAACGQKPKTLVLYYSQTSNTETVAKILAEKLHADIEAVIPVEPYEGDFQATVERGKAELDSGNFPAIRPIKSDVSKYDVVFIGYPVWFGTYANPVATLLEKVNLRGKKVVPFCTFGSGGLESSSEDLKKKLPESEILPGYGVRAVRVDAAAAELDRFLKESGFVSGSVEPLAEFSEMELIGAAETRIFFAAVKDYPMIKATPAQFSWRRIPGGTEYCFQAIESPREDANGGGVRSILVYVTSPEGQMPYFTRVVR